MIFHIEVHAETEDLQDEDLSDLYRTLRVAQDLIENEMERRARVRMKPKAIKPIPYGK